MRKTTTTQAVTLLLSNNEIMNSLKPDVITAARCAPSLHCHVILVWLVAALAFITSIGPTLNHDMERRDWPTCFGLVLNVFSWIEDGFLCL